MFQWLSEKPAKPAVQGDLSRPKTGTLGAGLCQGLIVRKPFICGSQIGAPQHGFCQVWLFTKPHLYIEGTKRGADAGTCVHRALKKTAFLAILAFDRLRPRTYNPRPRCFAADVAKR